MKSLLSPETREEELEDRVEGLEEDLKSAVAIAWKYGAKNWVRMNYPRDAERLERFEYGDERYQ